MAAYGWTPAGFVVKPQAVILAEMQQDAWNGIDSTLDLSPQTPDGQMLAIVSSQAGSAWELFQIVAGQYNREDAEGAALDNLGDIVGVPREGETYTQVFADLTIDAAHAPYAAGSLVSNISGQPTLTFANVADVAASMISGGVAAGVLMQATVIGPTPPVNPGTLTEISTSVTGWTAITNPEEQSQLGTAEELDEDYAPRQAEELAAEGSCNPSATAAAIEKLGAAQQPAQTLTVLVLENTSTASVTIGGVTLPPHTYAPVVYDNGTGWASSPEGQAAIGATIYENKPTGITPIGTTSVVIVDAILGDQTVFYSVPTPKPLFITATIVPRPGSDFTTLAAAVRAALVAAALAKTPADGVTPLGQLLPGSPVVGSQLEAVMMATPGMFDVQALTFDFHSLPSNTAPLVVAATQIATIRASTVDTNVVLTLGSYP